MNRSLGKETSPMLNGFFSLVSRSNKRITSSELLPTHGQERPSVLPGDLLRVPYGRAITQHYEAAERLQSQLHGKEEQGQVMRFDVISSC